MTSVSDMIVTHNNWNSVFYDSSLIHPCLFSILISCSYSTNNWLLTHKIAHEYFQRLLGNSIEPFFHG